MTGSRSLIATLFAGTALVAAMTGAAASPSAPHAVPTTGFNVHLISVTIPPKTTDVWALSNNYAPPPTPPDSVIHQHNGHWSKVKLKGVPKSAYLAGIAAGSAKRIWLVGSRYDNSTLTYRPVIATSVGHKFTATTLPTVTEGQLLAVAASSPSNAWVLGQPAAAGTSPFASHWNGHKWTTTSLPMGPVGSFGQGSISTSGPNNTWVTGRGAGSTAFHWDGSSWTEEPLPAEDTVSAIATTAAHTWAVGEAITDSATTPLAFSWTGTMWKDVALTHTADREALQAVTAIGSTAYAVGNSYTDDKNHSDAIAVTLTPKAGRVVTTPAAGGYNVLDAVAASSRSVVAVGTWEKGKECGAPFHPLAETLARSTWKRLAVPHTVLPASKTGQVACG